jgi:LysR family glycine cleavage system transcriptional activator
MRRLPPLKSIQAFEAASRLGSFTAAANELLVTPSAISHQIRHLEGEIGTLLFHRAHRSIMLTDAGRHYAAEIASAFGAMEAATRSIERRCRADILTIHTVPSFAAQWLMPRISRFSAKHTGVDVRLNASAAAINLPAGEADLHLHYGTVIPAAGVTAMPFPPETIIALCAPSLAFGKRPIRTPSDLRHHTLIHSEVNLIRWRGWLKQYGYADAQIDLDRGPRFDRSFMAISAAVDGVGICLESRLLVQRELDAGHLVALFDGDGPRIGCHSLLFLKAKANVPKIKSSREWLFAELNASQL